MLPFKRAAGLLSLAVLLTSLSACANGLNGKSLEESLAADPRLNENPVILGGSSDRTPQPEANTQLPLDFPTEIPRYPNAQLTEVTPPTPQNNEEPGNAANASQPQQTRWVTSDPTNSVVGFYQKELQANNWQILSQPNNEQEGTIEARQNDLQLTVSVQPSATTSNNGNTTPPDGQNSEAVTEFVIQYDRNANLAGQTTNPQAVAPPSQPNADPILDPANQPTPTPEPNTPPVAATEAQAFTDLDKAPPELRQYIQDLVVLGVLPVEQAGAKSNQSNTSQFQPNQIISHREFARWLFATNNQINANRPSLQIRASSSTSQPAFQDVPRTDPDFPIIQGLAEAGLIPSPLSGDSTAVLFRPDAPLTREQLLLWKVPLDTRQALPNASVDAVKQTWGFQDATKIDPKALRAVLADFQNGEQSNVRRSFGYTTLFQPKKPVNRAEAAAALWFFGSSSEGISAREALKLTQQQNQPQPSPPAEPTPSSSASPVPQVQ